MPREQVGDITVPVVTGLGLVTPFGLGPERFLDGLMGRVEACRFRELRGWPWPGRARQVASPDPMLVDEVLEGESRRNLNPETELLLAAVRLALRDANVPLPLTDGEGAGLAVSTQHAGLQDYAELFRRGEREGRCSPGKGPQTGFNAPAAHASIRLGAAGPNATFCNGPVGGIDALAWAVRMLEVGDASMMLVCGVDVTPRVAANNVACGWSGEGGGSRPFDFRRKGTALADAAVVVVLEDAARVVGDRPVRATVGPIATTFSPDDDLIDAAVRAFRRVGEDAVHPIAACFAGANGSVKGDAGEAFAIHEVFGAKLPVSAVQGAIGDTQAAAGLVGLAAACVSLGARTLPPTVGLTALDPALPQLSVLRRPQTLKPGTHVVTHSWDRSCAAGAVVLHGPEKAE